MEETAVLSEFLGFAPEEQIVDEDSIDDIVANAGSVTTAAAATGDAVASTGDEDEDDGVVRGPGDPQLGVESSDPEFIAFFNQGQIVDELVEGGGLLVQGPNGSSSRFVLDDGNDIATGGEEVDIFVGGGGDDNLLGAGGNDFIFGNDGNDIIQGGSGSDVLNGGPGTDLFITGEGPDSVQFFADQFVAGQGNNVIQDFEAGDGVTIGDSVTIFGSTDVELDNTTGVISVDGLDVITIAGAPLEGVDVIFEGDQTTIA